MRQCPKCNSWTLDFDDYFGRYRCFNPGCGWMPASAIERKIRLLQEGKEPQTITKGAISELGITVTVKYDSVNDSLIFSFGEEEITFDLPEPDGRFLWKVSKESNRVVGFEILAAKKLGVSEIQVNIVARMDVIEQNLSRISAAFSSGRPTRMLITSVAVTADQKTTAPPYAVLKEAVNKFNSEFCGINA